MRRDERTSHVTGGLPYPESIPSEENHTEATARQYFGINLISLYFSFSDCFDFQRISNRNFGDMSQDQFGYLSFVGCGLQHDVSVG